jgi:hypothetical protein
MKKRRNSIERPRLHYQNSSELEYDLWHTRYEDAKTIEDRPELSEDYFTNVSFPTVQIVNKGPKVKINQKVQA